MQAQVKVTLIPAFRRPEQGTVLSQTGEYARVKWDSGRISLEWVRHLEIVAP